MLRLLNPHRRDFIRLNRLSEEQFKATIFSPPRRLLRKPNHDISRLSIVSLAINKLFDTYDFYYLIQLLSQKEGIYGILTEFGEPVHPLICYNPQLISVDQIKGMIESLSVTYISQGKEITKKLDFSIGYVDDIVTEIEIPEFLKQMFKPFDMSFSDYDTYSRDQLATYIVSMPQAGKAELRRRLISLVSHLSIDEAIVRFQTKYDDKPRAYITFVTGQI